MPLNCQRQSAEIDRNQIQSQWWQTCSQTRKTERKIDMYPSLCYFIVILGWTVNFDSSALLVFGNFFMPLNLSWIAQTGDDQSSEESCAQPLPVHRPGQETHRQRALTVFFLEAVSEEEVWLIVVFFMNRWDSLHSTSIILLGTPV